MDSFTPFDYKRHFDRAMRSLIREVLKELSVFGLEGNHFFSITVDTTNPDVELADSLRKQYPQKVSIVLQYQFSNLVVRDEDFEVTLSFGGVPQKIKAPFSAIINFSDPSTGFVLELQPVLEYEEEEITHPLKSKAKPALKIIETKPKTQAQIIDLDQFRNRNKKYQSTPEQDNE